MQGHLIHRATIHFTECSGLSTDIRVSIKCKREDLALPGLEGSKLWQDIKDLKEQMTINGHDHEIKLTGHPAIICRLFST